MTPVDVPRGSSSGRGTFVRLWEFRPEPRNVAAFERAYGPEGEWAKLFRQARGYLGTVLLRPEGDGSSYLTIDRWDDEESWRAFLEAFGAEYRALDARLASLAGPEREIGSYTEFTP